MGHHATLATPLLVALCQPKARLDIVYLCAMFNDSSFSHPRYIIGAAKFKMGHVTLTTAFLRVICSLCAWT